MKKSIKLFAAAVGLSILLTGLAFAYQLTINYGALHTGATYEERIVFESPTGSGSPSGRFSQHRTEILIPVEYGRLLAITQSAAGPTILWYESQDGIVRNVALLATGPVVINRKGSLN